jgi:hypothetical protein
MPAALVFVPLLLCAAADPGDDEARIERLIHQRPTVKLAPTKTPTPAAADKKPEAESAGIGHKVRIRTVERGLYAGTLLSLDANSAVLRIDLPAQSLNYTLPRSGIAELEDLEPAP